MLRVAIVVDGAFFLKSFKNRYLDFDSKNPATVAEVLHKLALKHLNTDDYLYRILFYDCSPILKRVQLPKSKKGLSLEKGSEAQFRLALHDHLKAKRKVAIRYGELYDGSEDTWKLKEGRTKLLLQGKKSFEALTDDDFQYNALQKGVDLKLGLDIASLAYKKQVEKIVLIASDSDFVPAIKLARREGIDVVLDSLGQPIRKNLSEHVDGIRSIKITLEDFQTVSDSITNDTP
jgi:uncharacterized LabA/DUF88 family protein